MSDGEGKNMIGGAIEGFLPKAGCLRSQTTGPEKVAWTEPAVMTCILPKADVCLHCEAGLGIFWKGMRRIHRLFHIRLPIAIKTVLLLLLTRRLVESTLIWLYQCFLCLHLSSTAMSRYAGSVLAQQSQWEVSRTAIFIALSVSILSAVFLPSSSSDNNIHNLAEFRIVIAWTFFSKRFDFFREHFKKTGLKMFRFRLLQVSSYSWGRPLCGIATRVIAIAGEANREIFLNDRSLDLSEGYRILVGGLPHTLRSFVEVSRVCSLSQCYHRLSWASFSLEWWTPALIISVLSYTA